MQHAHGLEFDFDFAHVDDGCVCSIERDDRLRLARARVLRRARSERMPWGGFAQGGDLGHALKALL